jgi:hypothetical protein
MEVAMWSYFATAPKRSSALLFLAAILCAAPVVLDAQEQKREGPERRGPTFSSMPRTPDPASINERQSSMRSAEKAAARKAVPPEQAKLALAQIAEDYRRIQVINNQMIGAAASSPMLNYESISGTTKEIGKRATRLKGNLSLPLPEGAQKRWAYGHARDAAQLKAALLRLDGLIMGFIQSPFFKNRDVVDTRAGAKVSGDLEEIIELSRLISADAVRLSKNPKAP